MSGNKKHGMLFNVLGIACLLIGSSLFYTGIKGLLIEYVTASPVYQFYFGLGMLAIAYKIFDKRFKGF